MRTRGVSRQLRERKCEAGSLVPLTGPIEEPLPPFNEPRRFLMEQKLAAGAYGQVWRALDTETGCEVAIKRIDRRKMDATEFLAEARAMERLADVCSTSTAPCLYAVYEDPHYFYLVEQYLAPPDWTTLADYIERLDEAGAPYSTRLRVGEAVLDAIRALHAHNIVSRDIKPDNMMYDARTGQAKVLDLGLGCFVPAAATTGNSGKRFRSLGGAGSLQESAGRRASEHKAAALRVATAEERKETVPGDCGATCTGWGTPAYMAPEAWPNPPSCYYGVEANKKEDIWAAGMVLGDLLLGEPLLDALADVTVEMTPEQKHLFQIVLNRASPRDEAEQRRADALERTLLRELLFHSEPLRLYLVFPGRRALQAVLKPMLDKNPATRRFPTHDELQRAIEESDAIDAREEAAAEEEEEAAEEEPAEPTTAAPVSQPRSDHRRSPRLAPRANVAY